MVVVSWFLAIAMLCYLGSMLYTLVLATFFDDDGPEVGTTPVDHSTDETLINYGSPNRAAVL